MIDKYSSKRSSQWGRIGSKPAKAPASEKTPVARAVQRPRHQYAALEARILFDAAGAATADHQLDDNAAQHAEARHVASEQAKAIDDRAHATSDAVAPVQGTAPANTVVVIDSRVENYQALLQGIDPLATVRIVGADEDGLQVISQLLGSSGNVGSLQIVSHGDAGMIRLGATKLDGAALANQATAHTVEGWRSAMTQDADILILGCDVAAGIKGQSFVQKLADLTQADVSASVDDTGNTLRGGNWVLEFNVGSTGTRLAFSDMALNDYGSLLADPADRAQTTITLPTNVALGSSGTGTITFDNNGGGNGYAPYVAVAFKSTGNDPQANNGNEGVTYKVGSATFLGAPVTARVLTFSGGQAVLSGMDNNGGSADIVFTLAQFAGMQNGDQLVIFELPFGSFTPAQSAAVITFGYDVGTNADLSPGLPVVSRGFYRLGTTPTNDGGDPVVFGDAAAVALQPKIHTSSYNIVTREDEQVAGANDTQTISYDVKIANGQGTNGFRAEMNIPDNIVVSLTDPALMPHLTWEGAEPAGVIYKIVDASTPLSSVNAGTVNLVARANGTYANAKIVAIMPGGTNTANGAGTDSYSLAVRYYVPRTDTATANDQADPGYLIDRVTGGDITGSFDARSSFTWVPADPDGNEGATAMTDDTLDVRVLNWEPIVIQKTVTGQTSNQLDDPAVNNDPLLGLSTNPALNNTAGAGAGDPDGVRSGDVLTYALNFQVSDYHGVRGVVITDILPDGVDIDEATAQFTFTANGQTLTLANMDPANVQVTILPDGRQQILFFVSQELAARGFTNGAGGAQNGDLLGDAFADAAASGLTRGTITYKALVLDTYRVAANSNSGNVFTVNENDVFNSTVTIAGTILNNTGTLATPTVTATTDGGTHQTADDSGATVSVKDGNLILEIYAVNGVLVANVPKDAAGNVILAAGDNVSYRMRYQTTQGDFTDLNLTAYLPDPYFRPSDANADGVANDVFTKATDTVSTTGPGANWAQAGHFVLGPSANQHPDAATAYTGNTIGVSTTPHDVGNSITFSFDDAEQPTNPGGTPNSQNIGQAKEVDLIFTVKVTNIAFAQSLQTTAQANENSERSPNGGVDTATPIQDNRIIQISLAAPSLQLSHGVIGKVTTEGGSISGTTLPGGATTPAVGGNLGAGAPGINGLTSANAITGTAALNGNITNLDAGDTLRIATTIVNSGNGEAFKVETGAIAAPPGYLLRGGGTDLATAGTNFRVMRGDGTVLVQGTDWDFTDASHTAIRMIDRNWTGDDATDGGQIDGQLLGALNADGTARTNGQNVIIITYDVVADDGTAAKAAAADNSTSTNTVVSYFGSNTSSSDYLPGAAAISDNATLLVARPTVDIRWQGDNTAGDKTITADDSNQGHSTLGNLVIGEKAYYDILVTVPEGVTTNLFADLNLPAGLKLDTSYNGFGYEIITTTAGVGANGIGINGQLAADFTGTGLTAAGAGNIAANGAGTLGNSDVDARINLGTITAGADGTATNNSFIIRVRVTVDNIAGNQAAVQRTAATDAVYTDLDGATGNGVAAVIDVADTTTGNDPTITIAEPTVTTVTTVAVVDIDPNTAGDQAGTAVDENGVVEYTITLSNTSGVKAWDLSFSDTFPPELRNDVSLFISSVTSANVSTNGGAPAALTAADFDFDTTTRVLTLKAGNTYDMDTAGNIVIKVRGTVNETAAGEASFSNTAETRWTSLDRSVANGNNNGAGERDGSNGLLAGGPAISAGSGTTSGTGASQATSTNGVNDYRTASMATVPVVALAPSLSRIGGLGDTSPGASNAGGNTAGGTTTDGLAPQDMAVGEIVRFRLVTRVPQGVVPDLTLVPNLPTGYGFLNDGTANVSLVSDGAMTASGLAGSGAAAREGDGTGTGSTAAFGSIQNSLSSSNFSSTDPRTGDTRPVVAIANSGTASAPRFSLGDVHNVDNDTDFEYVVIEFNAVVLNTAANQAGANLNTSFVVTSGATTLGTSNTTVDRVVEPDIPAVTKQVVDLQPSQGNAATPQSPTNVITTQVSYTAGAGPNTTAAYDVVLTDGYPGSTVNTLRTLTVGATTYDFSVPADVTAAGLAGISFTSNPGMGVSVTIARVDPGTTVTLRYESTVPTGAAQAADGTANAVVSFSSLPDTAGWAAGSQFAGSTVGADGTAANTATTGERTGAGGLPTAPGNPASTAGPLNNYQALDSAGFGTIAGTLWDDTINANGTIDAGETLLNGVTVTLTWAGLDGVFGNADDSVVTTTTNASGQYSFGALPGDDAATAGVNEGRYRVSVPTTVTRNDTGDAGNDTDILTNRFDRTDGATGGLDVGELTLGDGAAQGTRDFGFLQPNDAPVNQIGGSATFPATAVDVLEDNVLAFTGANLLTITDPDGGQGDALLSTTLTVTNGTLAITTTGTTVTGGASGTTTITLQGTKAQINAALATLTFTGTNNFSGAATLTITTNDRGQGGQAGGVATTPREAGGTASPDALTDTDVVNINIVPVSDAPRLTIGTPPTTSPPPPGTGGGNTPNETVSGSATGVEDGTIPLGLSVTPADTSNAETITSFTISGVPTGWSLVVDGVPTVSTGTSQVFNIPLADVPTVGLRPPADFNQTATPPATLTITTTSEDAGETAATTVGTLTVNVTPVNDRPVLNDGTAIDLGTMAEGTAASTAQTVGTLFGPRYADTKDAGEANGGDSMIGVFVTGSAANATTEGSWQYSTDGGTTWVNIPASTSDATAIYLANANQIRFAPVDSNYSGTPGQLTVRLVENDQTPAGTIVADVPNGAAAGTTIGTALNTTPGSTSNISAPVGNAGQFATGRVSEALNVGITVTPVSDPPILTIGTGTPEPGNPPGTTGEESSPPSPPTGNNASGSVTGSVRGVEDTPIPLNISVTPADTSNVETVTTVVISGVPAGWVIRDGTNTVVPLTAGSTAGLTPAQLVGLTITAPSDVNSVGLVGTTPAATLTITVSSTDGAAPAATTTGTLNVAVTPVNDRPVLTDATTISLGNLAEGTMGSPAQTVGTLFGPRYSDTKDAGEPNGGDGMIGVFITGSAANAATEGSWQYSIDGGTTWINVPASTSDATAIYLANANQVRFIPVDSNYSGTPGQLTVRLVENDQTPAGSIIADVPNGAAAGTTIGTALNTTPGSTSDISAPVGNAGQFATGRVSEALNVAIVVTPVSDAPILTIGSGTPEPGNPPDTTGEESSPPSPPTGNNATATVTGSVRGVEDTPIPLEITVAPADTSNAETVTTVVISGVPAGWVIRDGTNTVVPLTAGSTAGLTPAQLVGLTITAPVDVNSTGPVGSTPAATLTITVSSTDGAAAAATTTGTLHIAVTPVNDRPVVNNPAPVILPSINEGTASSAPQTVGALFNPRYSDPKDNAEPNGIDSMIGIFVTGTAANPVTEGVWQYSVDGGTTWVAIPASTSNATAIYLSNASQLRFQPVDSNYSGTPGQLTVRLVENDQTPAGVIVSDVPNGAAAGTTIGTGLNTTPGSTSDIAAPVLDADQFATGRVSEALNLGIVVLPVSDAPILTIGTGTPEPGNPPGTTGEQSSPEAPPLGNNPTAVVTGSVRGVEDQPIPLDITVVPADSSSPETVVTVVISGVPDGWVIRDGNGAVIPVTGGKTGQLTPAQLAGATITAPRDDNSIGPVGSTPAATLTITATSTDANAADAVTTGTLHIAVTPVNDRPVVNGPIAPDYLPLLPGEATPGRTVQELFGPRFTDPRDAPEPNGTDVFAGVAVIRTPPASQGIYQFSVDGGATWTAIAAGTTPANAVVLAPNALLRFVSNAAYIGDTEPLQAVLIETDQQGTASDLPGRAPVPGDAPGSGVPVSGTIIDLSGLEGNEQLTVAAAGNSRFSAIPLPMQVGVRIDPPYNAPPDPIGPYVPLLPLIPVYVNPVLTPDVALYVGDAVQESQRLAALEEARYTEVFESNLGNSGLQPNWIAPEGIPGMDPFASPLPQLEAKAIEPPAAVVVPPLPADANASDPGCLRPRVVAKPRPPGAPRPAPRFPPGSEAAKRFSEQLKKARARARC